MCCRSWLRSRLRSLTSRASARRPKHSILLLPQKLKSDALTTICVCGGNASFVLSSKSVTYRALKSSVEQVV